MIKNSELILNPDGSVYHLNLKPENIAQNIVLLVIKIELKKLQLGLIQLLFLLKKENLKHKQAFFKIFQFQ